MVTVAEGAYQWVNRLDLVDQDSWNHDYYWVMHNAGRYDEAESYCRRVIQHEPFNLAAYAFLGHILGAHLRKVHEAEEEYRRGLEADDEDPTLHFFLGELLEQQGRFDEAETKYRRALGHVWSPKDKVRVLSRLGKLLKNKLGRTEEGIRLFRQAIENSPEDFSDLNSLAWNLYTANIDLNEAGRLAKKAVEINPESPHSLQTLAAILVRLDKWDEAKPRIKRWVQIVDAEALKHSWHDFRLLFFDAIKNGHAVELAALLECRSDDTVWALLRSALRATDDSSNIFVDLPPHLQSTAAQLRDQMLSDDIMPSFPRNPASDN
jgi:tetratricopeptide (TPR) repeat protein